MPGVYQLSIDELRREVDAAVMDGVMSVIIFGLPSQKDEIASQAYNDNGIVQRAIRFLKSDHPDLMVVTDVCLCEYMSHGHCGIVKDGIVLNDSSLELLSKTAISYAAAGADIVAPSDMMDARIACIRDGLDSSGFETTPIMSYAAKYASAFYGPFRDAAESAPQFGDRRTYQMDPSNRREAILEVLRDIQEGADIIMIKPALSYLDIIRNTREVCNLPVAAYNVSGEYAMVKAASMNGWIDERSTVLEIMTSIKRAGADIILTYHARDILRWIS
jgi:porphobilinogen synthase